ncbi:MAG: hypothetical protein IJW64_04595, partial [Clostridia bacterium]|nr:hypothetical protein [Clostridia bacterium]
MKKKILLTFSLVLIMAISMALSVFTAFANSQPVVHTGDDMISSGKLYDSLKSGGSKLESFNGVVSSSGDGHIIYDEEVDGVDIDLKITSGSSIFLVLRANQETAVWEGGHGYFLMINDKSTHLDVQLIKGAQTGTSFTVIKTATTTKAFFDGEKHNVRYVTEDVDSKVVITFTLDETEILSAEDTENVYLKQDSHFYICSGSAPAMCKLYSSNGEDFDLSNQDVTTLTSKTMLSKVSNWALDGALMSSDREITGNRDQSKAVFTRELKNVIYSFDIKIEDIGENWLAVYLNTSKVDVPWNDGFRSVIIFFRSTGVSIEYWNPQQILASVEFASNGITLNDKIHVETGLYDVELSTGTYTFVKLAINGTELYNQPILSSNVTLNAGYFGILNYGTTKYTLYQTENEVDPLPSATDGVKVERA